MVEFILKNDESIIIGECRLSVLRGTKNAPRSKQVRIGIDAPRHINIAREELYLKEKARKQARTDTKNAKLRKSLFKK